MHTDAITDGDGQLTQVGTDPLDYVLRYAAGDYDCYYQGRYIGSRPTLPKAIEAVEYEQAKITRHPHASSTPDSLIATYRDELRTVTAHLNELANRLASHPAEHAPMRAQLMLAHIRISNAIKSLQEAERSCALADRALDRTIPLDAAA